MKKLLLIIAVTFLTQPWTKAQCVLTESSFENWTYQTYQTINGPLMVNTPDGWTPLVSQALAALTGLYPGFMQQPTDAQNGTISLQMYADNSGTYINGGDLMNISACNTDPGVVYGYHKFEGWTAGDTAYAMAFAIDYSSGTGDTIGTGVRKFAAEQLNWTGFNIPISYTASGADSLALYVGFFPSSAAQPKRFKIDNFTFQPPSAIEINEMAGIRAFPNPFTNDITIDGLQQGDMVTVYDISGRRLIRETVAENSITLLGNFTSGMYTIEIVHDQHMLVKRVCKN